MSDQVIQRIESFKEPSFPSTPNGEARPSGPESSEKFQAALEAKESSPSSAPLRGVIDVARESYSTSPSRPPGLEAIQETTAAIQGQIQGIKEVLSSPDATVRRSYQTMLTNKLEHIDEALTIAVQKTGAEGVLPPGEMHSLPSGVEKFLGFLTRSQHRIDTVVGEINQIRFQHNGEVRPADLMGVQVKVNFVQQELELFTNLLNKGLESTKTLLNVQI